MKNNKLTIGTVICNGSVEIDRCSYCNSYIVYRNFRYECLLCGRQSDFNYYWSLDIYLDIYYIYG